MVETAAIVVGSISILTLIIAKLKMLCKKRMVVVTMGAVSWIRVW